MSKENQAIELQRHAAHLSSVEEQDAPYTISGIAIGEGDITLGQSGIQKKWPREALKPAADSLEGRPLVVDHDNSVYGVVGKVTRAEYNDGVGVLYEAELDDEELAEKIENGRLEVSIRGFHGDVEEMEEDEETGAKLVEHLKFDNLSIVPSGAAPSNTASIGSINDAQPMEASEGPVTQSGPSTTLSAAECAEMLKLSETEEAGRPEGAEKSEDDSKYDESPERFPEGDDTPREEASDSVEEDSESMAQSNFDEDEDEEEDVDEEEEEEDEEEAASYSKDKDDDYVAEKEAEIYETEDEAAERGEEIGCAGAHEMGDGWAPCSTHEAYMQILEGEEASEVCPLDNDAGGQSTEAGSDEGPEATLSQLTIKRDIMTDIEAELQDMDDPTVIEGEELEALQESAGESEDTSGVEELREEFKDDLAELKDRTAVLDEVDRAKVDELSEADDPMVVEASEYDDLQKSVETVTEIHAEALSEYVGLSAEKLAEKLSLEELREELEAQEDVESAEEELSPNPQGQDVEEDELEEAAEEQHGGSEELSADVQSEQERLRDRIFN